MSIWTLPAAALLSLLGWYETRQLGNALDDAELRETAPITGALVVGLACASSLLVSDVNAAVGLEQGVRLTAGSIIWLLGVQAVLADAGVVDTDWSVLPSPLDAHAREKIGG